MRHGRLPGGGRTVRAIGIQLSQGAKPGLGGVLPAAKVSPRIARIPAIGVDGQAGPLVHEEDDLGYGFYTFHPHHMHVSMNGVYDVVESVEKTCSPSR